MLYYCLWPVPVAAERFMISTICYVLSSISTVNTIHKIYYVFNLHTQLRRRGKAHETGKSTSCTNNNKYSLSKRERVLGPCRTTPKTPRSGQVVLKLYAFGGKNCHSTRENSFPLSLPTNTNTLLNSYFFS